MLILPTLLKTPSIIGGGAYVPQPINPDNNPQWRRTAISGQVVNSFTTIFSHQAPAVGYVAPSYGFLLRWHRETPNTYIDFLSGNQDGKISIRVQESDTGLGYYNRAMGIGIVAGQKEVLISTVTNLSVGSAYPHIRVYQFLDGVYIGTLTLTDGGAPMGSGNYDLGFPVGILVSENGYNAWGRVPGCTHVDRIAVYNDTIPLDWSLEANYREIVSPNGDLTHEAQCDEAIGVTPSILFGGGAAGWNGGNRGSSGTANWTLWRTFVDA